MASKKEIMTDPILRKAHAHEDKKKKPPDVCLQCRGSGISLEKFKFQGREWEEVGACSRCNGEGVIYT